MDVYGFLSLITGKKLKFTSLSEFEDGFEGRMPIQNEVTLALDFTDMSQSFSRPVSEVDDHRNRLEAVRRNTRVTSWQQLDSECSLMWRVYGSRQNGVAIKTTAGNLLGALDSSHNYIAGPVRYINYVKEKILDETDVSFSFHKQHGYLAEQEFRVAVTDTEAGSEGKPKLIGLDLNKVLEKVVVSPWAGEWQLNALKMVVESQGIEPRLVRHSSIMKVGER